MAWTAPKTAAPQSPLTAADWNMYIRDNLLETAAAAASAANPLDPGFVGGIRATGLNALEEIDAVWSVFDTGEGTTATTGAFGHLTAATPGPVTTVTTNTTAVVMWEATMRNNAAASGRPQCSVRVTGATSITANEDWMLATEFIDLNEARRVMATHAFTTLTPGANSFTLLYRSDSGTSVAFKDRMLIVIPF